MHTKGSARSKLKSQTILASTLYLVPTPIGNLSDITFRAVEVLKGVDLIACEDTRTTGRLCDQFDIDTPRTSFHAHNEHRKTAALIEKIKAGSSIALVSDAGSPGISDPGYLIVREAVASGIDVVPLPGPSALIPAITASGLPTDRFVFEGFLPQKKGRIKRLTALQEEERTTILYEAPHRIVKLLKQIDEVLGSDRYVVVARELTKRYEEFSRGKVSHVLEQFAGRDRVRGELVVMIAGAEYVESIQP